MIDASFQPEELPDEPYYQENEYADEYGYEGEEDEQQYMQPFMAF